MNIHADANKFSGALTLLRDCVGGESGQRLLIVSEPAGSGFYDDVAPAITASAGRTLGLRVYQTESSCFLKSAEDKDMLLETLRGFDHIVFFSRVGDQIRFDDDSALPSSTMCYTLDLEALNSEFGTACYFGLCDVRKAVDDAFRNAGHVQVTCPLGTDYAGQPDWPEGAPIEVRIKRFPMLISRPIPAAGMHGRVALSRFLVGTGSRFYDPYCLPLTDVVFARVDGDRILGFEGEPDEVSKVAQHYAHVSELFAIDAHCVHSWHAGIHPGCHFQPRAESDILRWSGTAFGNPRILHFHTCGNYAPGEISWNILDPTIRIDDVAIWEDGRLYPERLAGSDQIRQQHPELMKLYEYPRREVGLD